MSLSSREQFWAFTVLVVAILIIGLAPVVTAGIMGKTLPDMLISVSDKTVTGLVGVLGTIAGMIFRTNRVDDARAENTGLAFEAIRAAAESQPPGPINAHIVNAPDQPVPVEERP